MLRTPYGMLPFVPGASLHSEPAWDPRVLLTLETRMEHEQESTVEAVSA